MKKWVFIIGIVACSILFFIAGALFGFSEFDKIDSTHVLENGKTKRVPSIISKAVSPLIGRIVDQQIRKIQSKIRIPSSPAIKKASQYKSMIVK